MKYLVLVLLLFADSVQVFGQDIRSLTDYRNNSEYRIVDFEVELEPLSNYSGLKPLKYTITWMISDLRIRLDNLYAENIYSLGEKKLHKFYYAHEALQRACPTGWHIPSKKEYDELHEDVLNSMYNWELFFYSGATIVDNPLMRLVQGGYYNESNSENIEDESKYYFWTSSSLGDAYFTGVAFAGFFANPEDQSVNYYNRRLFSIDEVRNIALPVRCVQNHYNLDYRYSLHDE